MKNLIFSLVLLFGILACLAYFLDKIDNRSVWYLDADQDGYGDSNIIRKSDAYVKGFVNNDFDCNDKADYISPDTTQWYSIAFTDEKLTSFDYNCDSQITQQYTQIASCPSIGGWINNYVPSCGEQGLWIDQCIETESGYQAKTTLKTQACH